MFSQRRVRENRSAQGLWRPGVMPVPTVSSAAFVESLQDIRPGHVQRWGNAHDLLISRDAKSPDKRLGKREE